ncbi:M56 family metallopeptidase [Aquiflexum sp. LQ15W]|uniref:TonB family protein n=1 Tax=Cognataquiflexum nitidum TaxID=2922272 RepID=UPI001F134AC1|nr:M56 family metallopeptidase [Cognataquiflexum nitidum]MCH6201014.1 M56 family metallopeptidase [Cognataquiflexum nitidum]
MNTLFNYLLEGSIILLLLYAFYIAFLSKLTFFGWNRAYLLGSLGSALVLPLLSFELNQSSVSGLNPDLFTYYLPEFALTPEEGISAKSILIYAAICLYGAGFLWTAARLATGIIKTFSLIRSSEKFSHNGLTIVVNPKFPPSSFFSYILLPEYQAGNKAQELIILHESEHASKLHTLDLIFVQVSKAIFWFHPLIKAFESSIHEVHEFQADTKVINIHPKKEYAQLLFNLTVTKKEQQFVNNFNQFQLKKRILMMNANKSGLVHKGRFLLALPLLGLMVFVFACEKIKEDSFPTAMDIPLENQNVIPENLNLKVLEAEEVFDVVEESPEFPGGMEAWNDFLRKNLKYPKQARSMGIEGTVYAVFEIRTDGSVHNIELLRGIGVGCDEEAMRVIAASPNWIPGKQRGRLVNVRMRLPIRFKLG